MSLESEHGQSDRGKSLETWKKYFVCLSKERKQCFGQFVAGQDKSLVARVFCQRVWVHEVAASADRQIQESNSEVS